MKNTTLLHFTETKRGHGSSKVYTHTAGDFIAIIKNQDTSAELSICEPTSINDGEVLEWSPDQFYTLPIEEQLHRCIRHECDKLAVEIEYEEATGK